MQQGIEDQPKRLLSQSDVAGLLHVSERALEKWRVLGFGPQFVKVGRKCLYRIQDVDAWAVSRLRRRTGETIIGERHGRKAARRRKKPGHNHRDRALPARSSHHSAETSPRDEF